MKILATTVVALALLPLPGRSTENLAGQVAQLSANAGLRSIAETSDASEVRVWRTEALTDATVGWVITSNMITVYSGSNSTRPVARFRTPRAATLLRVFNGLSRYNGQWLSCGRIKDGWGLSVEGSNKSGLYAIAASTPNVCASGGASEVWLAYRQLLEVTGREP
jgi:hypothetical protein